MLDDQETVGEYAGRRGLAVDPDDGSGAHLYVGGEPCYAFRVVAVPDTAREPYAEELR